MLGRARPAGDRARYEVGAAAVKCVSDMLGRARPMLGRARPAGDRAGRRFPRALLRGGSGRREICEQHAWPRSPRRRPGRPPLPAGASRQGRPSCADLLYKLCGIVRLPP